MRCLVSSGKSPTKGIPHLRKHSRDSFNTGHRRIWQQLSWIFTSCTATACSLSCTDQRLRITLRTGCTRATFGSHVLACLYLPSPVDIRTIPGYFWTSRSKLWMKTPSTPNGKRQGSSTISRFWVRLYSFASFPRTQCYTEVEKKKRALLNPSSLFEIQTLCVCARILASQRY